MNEVEIRITSRDDTDSGVRSANRSVTSGLKKTAKVAAATMAAAGAAAGGLLAKGIAGNMNLEVANDKLAAQLGLTSTEAKKAGEVAGAVYADNWGGSIEEVNAAIQSVGTNLGDVGKMSKKELQGMTESALALSQTFDVDVNESTAAAAALIKNGLAKNSTQAFDIITAGFQNGVNKAGDFTDTLTEYSPQFKKLGIQGKEMLDILSTGLKAGARDTDVIADGFKELSIRAIDGTKLTAGGFKAIGLNAKDMGEKFAKGGSQADEATSMVIAGLDAIQDPVKKNLAGVALFGTQWEDTIQQILPALANMDGGIQGIDGSTKKMAATVGDNAQAKIDTLKRGFEQWTQKMAGSEGALGLVTTATTTFGGGALQAASQISMVITAVKGMNVALLMNPIGLTVAAIAGLVVGLTVLWKRSQTAREIMSTAFAGITTVVLTGVKILLQAYKGMADGVLTVVEGILRALGKIPGNNWADRAADDVKGFKDKTEKFFDGAIKKTDDWKRAAQNMPKKIKLEGDIRDLQRKVDSAKAKLRTIPRSRNARVLADIRSAQDSIARIRARLLGIKDRYVNVFVSEVNRDRATAARGPHGKATGGVIGAATGGARGGLVEVGEHGRELVRLPFGSTVIPHGGAENLLKALAALRKRQQKELSDAIKHGSKSRTGHLSDLIGDHSDTRAGGLLRSIAGHRSGGLSKAVRGHQSATPINRLIRPGSGRTSAGGDSGDDGCSCRMVLEIRSAGSRLDDLLVELIRKAVRAQGGNVQLVLGKN